MFQSTRPVRGATLSSVDAYASLSVSIHAPRTGRDADRQSKTRVKLCFNPRAPYGARPLLNAASGLAATFQSTRPVRGATSRRTQAFLLLNCFNPRAPYGARHTLDVNKARMVWFQSTRPVRGATYSNPHLPNDYIVSIHAPRTGRDAGLLVLPRARNWFQSTRPVRGAT